MKQILILVFVVSRIHCQESCVRQPDVSEGRCTLLKDCPFISKIASAVPPREFIRRYGGCGEKDGNLRFCCPLETSNADIDECGVGTHNCHPYAICTNTVGGYTCQCRPPYRGDGRSCSGAPCNPPYVRAGGLGCVLALRSLMSGEGAQRQCQAQGGRLLENIRKEDLKELSKVIGGSNFLYFVGIRNSRWISSQTDVPNDILQGGAAFNVFSESCGYITSPPNLQNIGGFGAGFDLCGFPGFGSCGGASNESPSLYVSQGPCAVPGSALCQKV